MARRPGDDPLEFCDVILDRADLDQFLFYNLRVSHEPNLTWTGGQTDPVFSAAMPAPARATMA